MSEIVKVENQLPAVRDTLSVAEVLEHVGLIQQIMKSVMKENEHYGKIPGCGDKPTLLKPGAEKLGLTFRIAPRYEITVIDLPNYHREYRARAILESVTTGAFLGEGVGSCSTMEGKYRYRTGPVEFTGQPVPKEYWDARKSDPERAKALLGGAGFSAKKDPSTGTWGIAIQGEKCEHDNPADYYNTCLKMAKKRAHVDAILTATAASDIFTQDVEDMSEVINPGIVTPPVDQPAKPPTNQPTAPPSNGSAARVISEPQTRRLFALLNKSDKSEADLHQYLDQVLSVQHVKDIPAAAYEALCAWVEMKG